jgi:7-keto-8-aminopelargonate synthetase-like enzyme
MLPELRPLRFTCRATDRSERRERCASPMANHVGACGSISHFIQGLECAWDERTAARVPLWYTCGLATSKGIDPMKQRPTSSVRASHHERIADIQATAEMLRARGLIHRTAEDARFDGRSIRLDGEHVLNFASCSYLALETDERLKRGAREAIDRYGVQFSSSRAYVSAPLYREYEELLSMMAGGAPVVVTQTTTLGHSAALPVLIGEGDAVLFDVQVHHSVQAVLPTLRAQGVPCEVVPHARLDRMATRARALARSHTRVFYLCDGVYSMHGDIVNVAELYALLDDNPQLFAYVDDSHGVGWAGARGSGVVLGHGPIHPRTLVALGLSKGLASGGAALVFPDAELADQVFTCGSTLIFSGPLQPALLGAGIEAVKFCLSEELPERQEHLVSLVAEFDRAAFELGLVDRVASPSPLRFVEIGDESEAVEVVSALKAAGYFVNVAVFPAVPRRRAGLRVMFNCHHTLSDIRELAREIARVAPGGRLRQDSVPPPSVAAKLAADV